MKYIPNAVSRTVGRQILKTQKHAPTILFGAGVVGVVATTVMASKATLKLDEIITETNDKYDLAKAILDRGEANYQEADYNHDLIVIKVTAAKQIGRLYGPSVVVGVISIACLTGSHRILTKRNVALTAAYSVLEKGFNEYRQRVIDEYGEEKEAEIRYSVETREIETTGKDGKKSKKNENKIGPKSASIYARYFDDSSTSWQKQPEYNTFFLKCQQNYANDLLTARGHLFLNEVYDMLGIKRSQAGSVVGWVVSKDGDNFVDFGIFDGDSHQTRDFVNGWEPYILLDFNVDGVIYDKI